MEVLPNLIKRRCGGWLAISPRNEGLKIGVLDETREKACEKYRASLLRWKSFRDDAANNRTNCEIVEPQQLPP